MFFRHGETDWNLNRRFQGHTDIPLNSNGQNQAEHLSHRVQNWKPDIILSSDLSRAVQTAEACLSQWKSTIVKTPLLREMNLGKAEGLHRDEVQALVGPGWEKWVSHNPQDEDFRFPEGESKAEARRRIFEYLEKFSRENPHYKRIAVSTHGGVLRRVTHGLLGTPPEGVPIPNCVTYRLNWDGTNWHYVRVRERASVLVELDEKLLTFRAVDPHSKQEYYFMPGGLIEEGETPANCVERECLEETGYPIRALPENGLIREYDFFWNNQLYWCRTHFLKGEILNPYEAPRKVDDADYNKGVVWLPQKELDFYFSFNEAIEEVSRKLIS